MQFLINMLYSKKNTTTLTFLITVILAITACSNNTEVKYTYPKSFSEIREERIGKLFGDLVIWDSNKNNPTVLNANTNKVQANSGIANAKEIELSKNPYIWQAALNVVSVMPISIVDSKLGIITTDWYQTSNNSRDRYKLNILLLGNELKSQSVKVTAFKEVKNLDKGNWQSAEPSISLSQSIEEKILINARKIKFTNESAKNFK